jgi:hypothetical protein
VLDLCEQNSSSRFAANSLANQLMPVRLPSGRARLATRSSPTGSSGELKTMGTAVVAALAANAAEVVQSDAGWRNPMIPLGFFLHTRSAASRGAA